MYADPTARRVEITSPEVTPVLNPLVDQIVLVSPRLALVCTQVTQQEWTHALTTMQHADPEVAATLITWRRSHHDGAPWAAPDMLRTRQTGMQRRSRANQRRTPLREYQLDLTTILIRRPHGPDPEQLIATIIEQVRVGLGTHITRGRDEFQLETAQFVERRVARGR